MLTRVFALKTKRRVDIEKDRFTKKKKNIPKAVIERLLYVLVLSMG